VSCKNPRKIDRSDIPDVPAEQAWAELVAASADGDLDDMKDAIKKYIKTCPDATYIDLEKAFRTQELNLYIIALEKELTSTYTNMDLQGNLDRKYSVTWRKQPDWLRPKEKVLWPQTPEENLARLADAGEPIDRGIPKCSNCDQLGHISKSCPEEKQENADRVMVKCFNCDEVGHRVRDCEYYHCHCSTIISDFQGPNPRPDKFACRNCKQSGHSSKECTEPRSAEGVECKKCGESKLLFSIFYCSLLIKFELVISLVTALRVVVEEEELAITVVKRATEPRTARGSARSSAVIVMLRVI
jgi:hypothetical protein